MPRGMGRGRGAVEKPKDFGGVMKKLVKFCSRYIPVMIFALVLGAAGTVCQIIGPDKLKDMTNEITKGLPAMVHGKPVMNSIDMDAVSRIAWLLVALYVGYALLSYLQSWLMANVTQRTAQELREAISKKINRLPLKYFDKVSYGDVLSRITNDVDAIGQTLGQSVGSLITSITLFVGALIMMFYNNVIMTLCAIGSALLGLIIMGVIMKVSQKYFTRQQVALGDVNGHVEEMYTGHTVVKAYCGEERSIEQFEKYNNDLYVSGWKSQFLSGLMMPIMNFVGNFGYVVVCVVGAALAMDGKIEFGVIVAFMMYIRLFTQPLSQFAQAFQNLQRCAAASERVFGFLEEPELSDETGKQALLGVGADGKPQPVRGDVEFSHVRFGYDADRDEYICPEKQRLTWKNTTREGYRQYCCESKICKGCARRGECFGASMSRKVVERHVWQGALDRVIGFTKTHRGKRIYRWRKETIERSFAEAKENHGLRYARMLGIANMREQCFLTAAVQNIKRLVASLRRAFLYLFLCIYTQMQGFVNGLV